MLKSSPRGSSRICLRLLYFLCTVKLLPLTFVVDATVWISTPNDSPFTKFLSDHRFEVCPTYEENECKVTNNNTNVIGNPELNGNKSEQTKSVPLDTVKSAEVETEEGKNALNTEETDRVGPSEQPPIATFDEWTKEKLKREEIRKAEQQQNQHQNIIHADVGKSAETDPGATPTSKASGDAAKLSPPDIIPREAAARNYASKECGAKVLFSNEEAENKNGVLNEKEADDYMRNPCERAEHKWLIIELCETIQPTALEIANFELFSSGPQKIRLSGSERCPSNEWIALGEYVAENSREIQRFPVVARSYVKFVRLELLTHYGREHYCTLSLVRLLGISMVDEYEAEAEAAAAISGTPFAFSAKEPAVDNDTATNELNGTAVMGGNTTKEDVTELTDTDKKNESANEMPLVNAVVNAVGSIGIGNIKGILESTFLGKSTTADVSQNIMKNNVPVIDICRNCFADISSSYLLFCRAFFGFPSEFNSISANGTAAGSNQQIDHVYQSVEKPNQKEKNSSLILKLFLASILSTRTCELEPANMKDFVSHTKATSNEDLAASSTNHPPTASGFLNAKLGAGFMLPGGVMSHKESIFFKLNKRISNLELNMSLSSEYLSELSRRYVLQTNENRRQAELIIKHAEEAAVNAVKPTIDALKIQVDNLAASLKELTETVKDLLGRTSSTQRTAMLKHIGGRSGGSIDSSLARSHANFYSYNGLWTTGELVCITVLVNILTLLILLVLHYAFSTINRGAVERVVDERLEKFIEQNIDAQPDAEIRERNSGSALPEPRADQHPIMPVVPTVSCDVADLTLSEIVCSSSLEPLRGDCSLTENETPEEVLPSTLQPMELADRPSSQLSTASEQNPRQARKRKKKKQMRYSGSSSLDESRNFGVLSNLETM